MRRIEAAYATAWSAALDRLEGAYSDNTLRAYRSDFARFAEWCHGEGLDAAPSTPEHVAAFITREAVRVSASTLRRRLAAIRKVHRLLRFPCPIDDEEVAIALRRALREKRSRPKQALALTAELRDTLIATCDVDRLGLRNRAMIAVGYDTLCRRSELVSLRIDDLVVSPRGAKILVRRSKVDPFGDGRWAYLSPAGLSHLQAWLAAANMTSGLVFRSAPFERAAEELHPVVVGRVLKAAALRAGLLRTAEALSGHSMRVGAAQDLMTAGRDLLAIMTAGRWSSPAVVGRYVANADLNIWSTPKRYSLRSVEGGIRGDRE